MPPEASTLSSELSKNSSSATEAHYGLRRVKGKLLYKEVIERKSCYYLTVLFSNTELKALQVNSVLGTRHMCF